MSDAPLLSLRDIQVAFDGGEPVVKGVSCDVWGGATTCIVVALATRTALRLYSLPSSGFQRAGGGRKRRHDDGDDEAADAGEAAAAPAEQQLLLPVEDGPKSRGGGGITWSKTEQPGQRPNGIKTQKKA